MNYEPISYTQEELDELTEAEGPWFDNSIQFPRLLCEIRATHDLYFGELCEAMDLEPEDIEALFERAEDAWMIAKENLYRD